MTVMKRSTTASDHHNLGEIDYPINTQHQTSCVLGELMVTRCNCPVMLSFSLYTVEFLVDVQKEKKTAFYSLYSVKLYLKVEQSLEK